MNRAIERSAVVYATGRHVSQFGLVVRDRIDVALFSQVGSLGHRGRLRHGGCDRGMVWLSVSLSQIAWPLALTVTFVYLPSPLGWARQIFGQLALKFPGRWLLDLRAIGS